MHQEPGALPDHSYQTFIVSNGIKGPKQMEGKVDIG